MRTASPASRISPSSCATTPGEDLDQRRLAGAVVAEQREDLALAQLERDVAQRERRAVLLGEPRDLEDGLGHVRPPLPGSCGSAPRGGGGARRARPPPRPPRR